MTWRNVFYSSVNYAVGAASYIVWWFGYTFVAVVARRVSQAVFKFVWKAKPFPAGSGGCIYTGKLRRMTLAETLVVGNEDHCFLILDQLRAIGHESCSIVLEPVGRNTAPALALAVHAVMHGGEDPILIVNPADHMVLDTEAFTDALKQAVEKAERGNIVVMGILPDRPETGYGYIHASPEFAVRAFVEKPDKVTAKKYVQEGCYYWNGGIFVQKSSVLLKALAHFRADIAQAVEKAWQQHSADAVFLRPDATFFAAVPAESIDYAVMEKCPNSDIPMCMVPLAAGWSDLGSWDAAW